MADFAMVWNPEGYADIVLSQTDIVMTDTLESYFFISLFCDARATDPSQIPDGDDPRGFWGDTFPTVDGQSTGSLLWTLSQANQDNDTLQLAIRYSSDCTQWMIDEGVVNSIDVQAQWVDLGILGLILTVQTDQEPVIFQFSISGGRVVSGLHTADSTVWTVDTTTFSVDEA